MTRVQIQVLTTIEFDICPENYPKNVRKSPEKMLAMDIKNAKDDPMLFLSMDSAKIKVRGKIVDGEV